MLFTITIWYVFQEHILTLQYQIMKKDISVKVVRAYSLVRADHSSNTKRGGVCIYYKQSVGVRIIDIPNLT